MTANERAAPPPKSVAEIRSFIDMLAAACDDTSVQSRLARLLAMPDRQRQDLVHAWVRDLLIAEAPRDFVQAIACLLDDRIAKKAYEVVLRSGRGKRT